jgi:hypothetical protein
LRVEIFFKIAALNIPTPLASALDGDSAIFSTTATVDFVPEVDRRVTCHRRGVPCRLAGIWPKGWSVLDRRRMGYGRSMRRCGVGMPHWWLAPPLMERRVDGSNDELIDAPPAMSRRRLLPPMVWARY